jgi:hypothetical protein
MKSALRPHQILAMSMLRQSLGQGKRWAAVECADRYLVSDHGEVYSTVRKGRMLRQTTSPQGYLYVSLMVDSAPKKTLVHRLVSEAFVSGFEPGFVVNHKDGDKKNNHYSNLEWCSYGDNNDHARATGLSSALGETHYASKLNAEKVREIRRRVAAGEVHKTVAADFGVNRQQVTKIVNGQAWRSVR